MATMKTRTIKPVPKASRKTLTAICPHCGEAFEVWKNGRYICPECENYVDVDDWFATPHVHQPDMQTCGWATTKWLLSAFGCDVPSNRQLERELHVRKSRDGLSGAIVKGFNSLVKTIGKRWKWQGIDSDAIDGTLPTALIATLYRHGLKPVFPGFDGLVDYSDYKDYMEDVFARHGRFALVYVNTNEYGTYAHWIGIEKFKGRKHIMDPGNHDYSPFSKHEALRGKRISMCCMIGFVRA